MHAAQHGAHAAAQLGDPDRLGHVVVGARLEREDGVGLAVAGRHRDHVSALARAAQAPADLDAVGSRPEADVEQDEVEGLGRECVERGAAVGCFDDDVAIAGERAGHHLAQVLIVLDDEDATPQSAVAVVAEHCAKRRAAGAACSAAQHDPNMPRSACESRLGRHSGRAPILPAMARTAAVASHTDRPHVVGRLRGLSVILPCHDEAQNVERAIDEATAAGELVADAHETPLVDDGSSDGTRELAQSRAAADPRVRVLVHDVNRGYGAAVRTGLAAARLEWIFLTDADLQFDVGELVRFVPLAQASDIVAGYRIRRADPPHRLLNAAAWNVLVRRVFDVPAARRRLRLQAHAPRPRAGAAPRGRGRDGQHRAASPAPTTRARASPSWASRTARRTAGRSSGASPRVVLQAFRELRAVRAELREGTPGRRTRRPGAPARGVVWSA